LTFWVLPAPCCAAQQLQQRVARHQLRAERGVRVHEAKAQRPTMGRGRVKGLQALLFARVCSSNAPGGYLNRKEQLKQQIEISWHVRWIFDCFLMFHE